MATTQGRVTPRLKDSNDSSENRAARELGIKAKGHPTAPLLKGSNASGAVAGTKQSGGATLNGGTA